MPGSGKSYWMRKLAHHFRLASIDLDHYIESTEHRSIAELFAMGESYFREIEMEALRKSVNDLPDHFVIATGGGVPFFHNNMEWMKANGTVIYLQADLYYLYQNLAHAYVERPLLQSQTKEGVLEKLSDLYQLRKEIYQKAHHVIAIETATVSTFAKILEV